MPDDEQVALARRLLQIARAHGATLSLHGDPRLARKAGLGAVHLSAGADCAAARALLGREALIGISIHCAEEAAALDPHVVDYCIAGPAFPTESKPGYRPCLGTIGLAEIAKASAVPVIAIGGIGPANVRDVVAGAARGVAVMGGVMRADPAAEIAGLLAALRS